MRFLRLGGLVYGFAIRIRNSLDRISRLWCDATAEPSTQMHLVACLVSWVSISTVKPVEFGKNLPQVSAVQHPQM